MSGWRGWQREQERHAKRTKDSLKDKERREEAQVTEEQREDELKPGLCSSMPTDIGKQKGPYVPKQRRQTQVTGHIDKVSPQRPSVTKAEELTSALSIILFDMNVKVPAGMFRRN